MAKQQHIIISGFMGSGKTTIARLLARHIHLPFFDTDDEIEKATTMTIPQIFKELGEPTFRRLETQQLTRLLSHHHAVISVGGGLVLSPLNRKLMHPHIWMNLQACESTLFKRLSQSHHRPLLGKKMNTEHLHQLLMKRTPIYNLADYQIRTDNLTPQAIIDMIMKILHAGKI